MPSLAITGSIGSGKSFVLRELGKLLRAKIFSADEANRSLLNEDEEVKALISSEFGPFYYREGKPDRKALFQLISENPGARNKLESILHPRIQNLWKPEAEYHRSELRPYFLAEIPLLYEKQLQVFFDKSLVVECSVSVRNERLQRSRSLSPAELSAWLRLQLPSDAKAAKADFLLWNDGSETQLLRQIHCLASHLLHA